MLLPRKQIFVSLAVLLARFRRQISRVHNRLKVDYTTEANYGGRLFSSTKKRSGESEHGSSKAPRTSSSTGPAPSRTKGTESSSSEQMAQEAAKCNGMFHMVKYPWPRLVNLWSDAPDTIVNQTRSPYIFKACQESGQQVFLKVWGEDDSRINKSDIKLEYTQHKLAQDRGVPVAPIVTDQLLQPKVGNIQF